MKISFKNINIAFGYKSVLKTYWREGKLPTVKKDIYGKEIINETVEHIIPKSNTCWWQPPKLCTQLF